MNRLSVFLHSSIHKPMPLFFRNTIAKAPHGDKKIYLTFDDGPHVQNTPALLKLLDKFDVKATFFLTGKNVISNPGLAEEICQCGHIVGNHGWQHLNLRFKQCAAIADELKRGHDCVAELSGFRYIFRPPYGAWNPRIMKLCQELGYTVVLWSFSAADYNYHYWQKNNLAAILNQYVKPGEIVLLHDGAPQASNMIFALEMAIEYWLEAGKTFGLIPEILKK
ncbi:MAG: polysaccharide deacetylase family protein [Calditrichaeota bacterium]|nr:MAG: polysaccharide deacetylase family protein [Calditrichota bacterium]